MAEKDQEKPLAPAVSSYLFHSTNIDTENDTSLDTARGGRRRKTFIKCCGCAAAILVIAAVTLIILAFTAFHVRGPIVRINAVTGFENITVNAASRSDNVTLTADVSVKNPNAMAVRYEGALTTVYYGREAIGEGWFPAGLVRARRTVRVNVAAAIAPAKMFATQGFLGDVAVKALTVESYTRIQGRVKIANIVRKKVVVHVNCTVTFHILPENIYMQHCKSDIQI